MTFLLIKQSYFSLGNGITSVNRFIELSKVELTIGQEMFHLLSFIDITGLWGYLKIG